METTAKERIIQFLKYKGIGQTKFEELCGLSRGYVYNLKKSPSTEKLRNILTTFPELSQAWLLTGEGEMLEGNARDLGSVYAATPGDRDSIVMVDYIPVSAQASFTEYLGQSDARYEEKLPLIATPAERAEIDRYKIFEVAGDSMFPTLVSGSKILVKSIPESSWHNAEGVVVAVFLDYVVIKRVKSNHFFTDHYIILSSDNPEYGEMTVQFSDIRALYKARRVVSAPIS